MKWNGSLLFCLVLAFYGCDSQDSLSIESYMPVPVNQRVGAVYLTLQNNTDQDLLLQGARTPAAKKTEIHQTSVSEGIMKMEKINQISVDPGQSLVMKPGGLHIMLLDLKEVPEPGSEIELTLMFSGMPDKRIRVPVVSPSDIVE
ncbi:MAG: copper chaperone PCu(A)C [Leptospiraceae bacterium]